jgi:putative acetyltransferase
VLLRLERAADVEAVDRLHELAFGRLLEADLLRALRRDPGWIPGLSLVAEEEGRPIGHVCCTRGDVAGAPALGLGPIAVEPVRQGRGIGSALVHGVLAAADASAEGVVCLLGEPAFYGRFGFVASGSLGIAAPDPSWGGFFQARALTAFDPGIHAGRFAYAAPFRAL